MEIKNSDLEFISKFETNKYYAFWRNDKKNERYYISNFGKLKEIKKNVDYEVTGGPLGEGVHKIFTNGTKYIFENGEITVTNIINYYFKNRERMKLDYNYYMQYDKVNENKIDRHNTKFEDDLNELKNSCKEKISEIIKCVSNNSYYDNDDEINNCINKIMDDEFDKKIIEILNFNLHSYNNLNYCHDIFNIYTKDENNFNTLIKIDEKLKKINRELSSLYFSLPKEVQTFKNINIQINNDKNLIGNNKIIYISSIEKKPENKKNAGETIYIYFKENILYIDSKLSDTIKKYLDGQKKLKLIEEQNNNNKDIKTYTIQYNKNYNPHNYEKINMEKHFLDSKIKNNVIISYYGVETNDQYNKYIENATINFQMNESDFKNLNNKFIGNKINFYINKNLISTNRDDNFNISYGNLKQNIKHCKFIIYTEIVLKPYDFFIYNFNEELERISNIYKDPEQNQKMLESYIKNKIKDKYVFLLKNKIENNNLKEIPYNSNEIPEYSKYIEFNDANELINNIKNKNVEFIGKYDEKVKYNEKIYKFDNNEELYYLLSSEYYFVSNIHNNSINFNNFKKYIKKNGGKRKHKTHKKLKNKKTKNTKRKHTKKYKN